MNALHWLDQVASSSISKKNNIFLVYGDEQIKYCMKYELRFVVGFWIYIAGARWKTIETRWMLFENVQNCLHFWGQNIAHGL